MPSQRTGRPAGRPRMPKDLKRRSVVVRLPPATIEAIEEMSHRGGYSSRTAFIEQAIDRAVTVARRRLAHGTVR